MQRNFPIAVEHPVAWGSANGARLWFAGNLGAAASTESSHPETTSALVFAL